MLISELKDKKILILGMGKEGVDVLRFLKRNSIFKSLGVADALPFEKIKEETKKEIEEVDTEKYFGKKYLSKIDNYNVLIKSPGVPLSLIPKKENQIITSSSDIFIANCKKKIIGITGTKGKSTTSVILNNAINLSGTSSCLLGNVGVPPLSYLYKKNCEIFVYELSSFQLETVKKSPHIAVFLNVFPDHLDKHKNFEEYIKAKERITIFQKKEDFFIYNKEDKIVREVARKTHAEKIPFSLSKKREGVITPLDPVFKVAEVLKIKKEFVEQAIKNFEGLPHRMEYIGKYNGIYFYNDSAATIPQATIMAIDSFKNLQTLIIGGSKKNISVEDLLKKIEKNTVKNIVLLPLTDENFQRRVKRLKKNIFSVSNMEEAVHICYQKTTEENICLLSPGFASFNLFKNYKERGDRFKDYVKNYK